MRRTLSERNIVIALFIMVLVTFALAQEDTKKLGKGFTSANVFSTSTILLAQQHETIKPQTPE